MPAQDGDIDPQTPLMLACALTVMLGACGGCLQLANWLTIQNSRRRQTHSWPLSQRIRMLVPTRIARGRA